MTSFALVGLAACLLASAQDEPLIPVRVVFSNPHAVSLHLYWFDPETPEVGSFLMTLAPSEERPVDTFIGEEYGVALDGAEELGARFSVRGALEPTHSAAIDDEVLCEFGAWPAGVPPPAAVLADVLPRLSAGNALAPESFNATRSAKWQFGGGALPGALEAAMEHDESALAWARPLVAALAEDGADALAEDGADASADAARARVVTFASPSAVQVWAERVGTGSAAACIGETSAAACREAGWASERVFWPEKPGMDGWLVAVENAARG